MQPSDWLITATTKNYSAWNGPQPAKKHIRPILLLPKPFNQGEVAHVFPPATSCAWQKIDATVRCVGNRVAFCTALSRLATVSRGGQVVLLWELFDSTGERCKIRLLLVLLLLLSCPDFMDVATDFTHRLWKLTNVVELVAKAKARIRRQKE